MNKLTTPVRRFCQAILRQYPLMKKELAALEEEKRKLVELHFFNGLPPWRVAQELGMSESNFYRYEKEALTWPTDWDYRPAVT